MRTKGRQTETKHGEFLLTEIKGAVKCPYISHQQFLKCGMLVTKCIVERHMNLTPSGNCYPKHTGSDG
jgi:hypothetical protein